MVCGQFLPITVTTRQAFTLALQHHQTGRLADAEAIYLKILAAQPNHADALHLLGVIAHQLGRHGLAAERIRQAISIAPGNPAAHSNLGEAYRALGQLDAAMTAYRHALELRPDYPDAYNNQGAVLEQSGRIDEAIAAYQRALQLRPDYREARFNLGRILTGIGRLEEAIMVYRLAVKVTPADPEAHHNLGVILAANGQLDEAITSYRRAILLASDYPDAHYNLGVALAGLGRFAEAVDAYRRALQVKPANPQASNNLGVALGRNGQRDAAIAAYHRAIQLKPDYPEAYYNLGIALSENGQLDEAITAYRRALQLQPDYPEACNNLGVAVCQQGHLDEAIAAFRHSLQLKFENPETHNNLGNALKGQGRLDEAIAAYRQAVQLSPGNPRMHSNLVYTLQFHPDHDDQTIAAEHQRWNHQFSEPLKGLILPHTNSRDPDRRLRVGYVSPDFRFQAEVFFVMPLLEAHDHQQFEIHCYASVSQPDYLTDRLRRSADVWHDVQALSDHDLARQIRDDGIDILVDLTMHMANNRLPVFARKPAPVQVAWLAYPGSTGLETMDYRLTDNHMDPPAVETPCYSESSVRLPDSWCCYDPLTIQPLINALPASGTAEITFGSLNNFCKVNHQTVKLFARALQAVAASRLILLAPEGAPRLRILELFSQHGILRDRIEFAGGIPRPDYLEALPPHRHRSRSPPL